MTKRVLIGSVAGAVLVGGAAAGLAAASAPEKPSLKNSSADHTAASGDSAGTFTFVTDVRDDSGVENLNVLAWPTASKLDPTEAELREVDTATCRSTSAETSRCTYTLKVTEKEEAELDAGTWQVSVLATAKDGDTLFVPSAATFDIKR
ncbi:DUF5707 domain-containing protein [Streptomyces sp. NEAU-W12]|uniref:DUF5707 domain-containing protein n=1 Tax=Streptomyces sp. NEAU-W12 TaxID=2994668 RepID=UPI00224A8F0E|nr:DUF5707 domain-containing protein [Streptomyces sp. NEAU-W12]MCX2922336.1 DUF5707 domain-containing protein [Streptomyces sp. NEAU-W12]